VVTYTVLVATDPTDIQLLPDMTATVTIITQQANNAIIVPNSAISWAQSRPARQATSAPAPAQGAQPVVYVLQNGAPVRVPIQTGISDGVTTQVISGLQVGQQVVTGSGTGSAGKSPSSSSPGTSSSGSRSILPAAPAKPGG